MSSSGYVDISNEPSGIPGSMTLVTDSVGSERSWIRILPKDKTKREGDAVMYADSALLVMRGGHLDSYVYLNKDNGEICSYHIVDPWYFKRFEPWDADDKILRYGVPYIVRHKELNLHLAARESDERPVSHSEYKFHPGRRSRMIGSSPAAMNESIVRVDTVYLT